MRTEEFLLLTKPISTRGSLQYSQHMADQKDQIWLWGAVLQGHVITHFVFRILDHPDEAHSGKPRGHGEMLKNINILGLRKGDTFVSDGWKATVSAVKAYRRTHRLSQKDLHHEIVNHSEGELVNSHGFATNPIEAKWSLIKRWIRHRMSGRLPGHSDRHMWRLLIDEYQTRNLLKARNPQIFDRGNIVALRFCEVVVITVTLSSFARAKQLLMMQCWLSCEL